MKKLILSVLFLCLFSICQAQIIKFRATHLNMRFFNDTIQTFDKWLGWEECNLQLDMNIEELTLIIYSEKEQKYTILKVINKIKDHTKNLTGFDAIDGDNEKCIIKLINILPTSQNYIHIEWKILELSYEIEKL